MTNRFKKLRELGSKGKLYNPLILDEFQWENEWVDIHSDPVHQGLAAADNIGLAQVDEAIGTSQSRRGRDYPTPRVTRSQMICAAKRRRSVVDACENVTEADQSSDSEDDDQNALPGGGGGHDDHMEEDGDASETRIEEGGGGTFQLDPVFDG